MPNELDEASLRAACAGLPLSVAFVARTGSTNDDLLVGALGDEPAGARLLCAGAQSAGRGRRGRRWVGDPRASLCFSVAVERRVRPQGAGLSGLSLACGVAIAEALVDICPGVRVKWPNDLLRDERKVGGILVEVRREVRIERIVIGTGLNLVAPGGEGEAIAPGALVPGGLFDAVEHADEEPARGRAELVARCVRSLLAAWSDFDREGFPAFALRWDRFDALRGRSIGMHDAGREIGAGVCLGVASDGALRLSTTAGERRFATGEASPRPLG